MTDKRKDQADNIRPDEDVLVHDGTSTSVEGDRRLSDKSQSRI